MRSDGTVFTDHGVHRMLRINGLKNPEGEWFHCTAAQVNAAINTVRKQIQEKLIKFATRVPIFMYLTDYRERSLRDVISQLEPGLFKKVTGLIVKDFEILVSLGVFNSALMNDAVYKFKRYEDSSLIYTGINKHEGEDIGLYDTVITRKDALKVFENIPAGARYRG